MLLSLFEKQASRVWVRLNVFVVIQFAVVASIFSGIELLQKEVFILNWVFSTNLVYYKLHSDKLEIYKSIMYNLF